MKTGGKKGFVDTIDEPADLKAVGQFLMGLAQIVSSFKDVVADLANGNGAHDVSFEFKSKGDLIFVVGESYDDICSSLYLQEFHKMEATAEVVSDSSKEAKVEKAIASMIEKDFINAVHSVKEGGLYVSLVEMAIPRGLGFDVEADGEFRLDAYLFGEGKGRMLISVNEEKEDAFIEFMSTLDVPSTLLGHVTKGKMVIDGEHFGFINEVKDELAKAL